MKSLTLSLAFLAGLAVPATAQQMGSANRNATKVEQAIEFHNGTELELSYTALNWAEGKFVERMKDERFQKMVNDNAKQNPLGAVKLSGAMEIGGKKIAAGSYGLHFLISDEGGWLLTLSHKNDDGEVELIQWPLTMEKAPIRSQRLMIVIAAGEGTTDCSLHMVFGSQHVAVAAACAEEN